MQCIHCYEAYYNESDQVGMMQAEEEKGSGGSSVLTMYWRCVDGVVEMCIHILRLIL